MRELSRTRSGGRLAMGTLLCCVATAPSGAHARQAHFELGARAIVLVTHARPALAGRDFTEAYVTQPMVSGAVHAVGGALTAHGMLNLEGLTLRRGELNAGIWGEGYIDRRHPHTYLHEAVLVVRPAAGHVSLTAGRGFVPFGTDDPMARPFVKYPANHHHAQILERWVAIAAVRSGPVALEAALFNGDEPQGPADVGGITRLGDSHAMRLTAWPARGFELQASAAFLASPELRGGGGLDHVKRSAAGRWQGVVASGVTGYALVEHARTATRDHGRPVLEFDTWLAEAELARGDWRAAARFEHTARPEEERTFDPFRTPQPHTGPPLGVTAWTIGALRLVRRHPLGALTAEPFTEVARLHVRETAGGVFRPREFYGGKWHWSVSAGVRLFTGPHDAHARAGRYGAAGDTTHAHRHKRGAE